MTLQRISGRKRVDRVLRKGRTWSGKHMRITWLSGAPDHPNLAKTASGVFAGVSTPGTLEKSSVRRNRMRRRTREALRVYLQSAKAPTLQLIIRPKSTSLDCAFEEISNDVSSFFSSLS